MTKKLNRLTYLDWMRGLAVVLMLQGHVMDGWLRTQDRTSEWFWLSQFLGGFPAPIFLFLVGVFVPLMILLAAARHIQRELPEIASRMLPMTAGSDSGK